MTDWTQEAIERRIEDRIGEPQPSEMKKDPHRSVAVVVTDIHMSFGSMVTFMVKWTIASIPALLIVFALALAFTVVLGLLGVIGLDRWSH